MNSVIETIVYILKTGLKGSYRYYLLLTGLGVMVIYGLYLWIGVQQAPIFLGSRGGGMITTAMSDSVPWGIYISFFIFWVGIAAAGILFGLGAYAFRHKDFMKIAVLGEVQAVAALVIALMLIIVDLGRPIRALFFMPRLPNLRSMLDWDFIVLTTYLVLNVIGVIYTIHRYRQHKSLPMLFTAVFLIISAPFAIGIHTVTAFISQALTARPIWNSPLLAPRYVATAFASGPALLLLVLLIAEKYLNGFSVGRDLYRKIILVSVSALTVGLYFTFSEAHEIFWYTTEPLKKLQANELVYGEHAAYLGVMFWLWVTLGVAAVILSLIPSVRSHKRGMALIAILIIIAVINEKTLTIVLPAFIPDSLGRVIPYVPTPLEIAVTIGVHALGLLVYAILAKASLHTIILHYSSHDVYKT